MTNEEQVLEIINYHTGRPIAELKKETTFEELELDSLDCIEVIVDTEDKFKIKIDDGEFECVKNIQDLINLVVEKQTEQPKLEPPKDENQTNN